MHSVDSGVYLCQIYISEASDIASGHWLALQTSIHLVTKPSDNKPVHPLTLNTNWTPRAATSTWLKELTEERKTCINGSLLTTRQLLTVFSEWRRWNVTQDAAEPNKTQTEPTFYYSSAPKQHWPITPEQRRSIGFAFSVTSFQCPVTHLLTMTRRWIRHKIEAFVFSAVSHCHIKQRSGVTLSCAMNKVF